MQVGPCVVQWETGHKGMKLGAPLTLLAFKADLDIGCAGKTGHARDARAGDKGGDLFAGCGDGGQDDGELGVDLAGCFKLHDTPAFNLHLATAV